MAFINAFQSGQQFQSLQTQREQDLRAGEQNILVQQDQNERADKSLVLREQQQAELKATRATAQERLAAQDEIAATERERVNNLRGVKNTVNFLQAGIDRDIPIMDLLQSAGQPLQAMGVSPDQFEALAQQIEQDPGILAQFAATLDQQGGAPTVRQTIPIIRDGKRVLIKIMSDGSSELVEDATPLAQVQTGRRLDIAEERIDPTKVGERQEEKVVGGARGEIRAEDLPKGVRATARAKRATAARQERVKLVDSSIDEALEGAGFFTTGFIGQALSGIGGTSARDLAATLDTIRANIGFDELQRLRDNSPTGGALGQVSERENILLQSVLGSIEQSQSESQFKRRLDDLKEQFKLSQSRIAQAFEDDFGVTYGGPGTPIPQQATGLEGLSDADLDAAIAAAQGGQ